MRDLPFSLRREKDVATIRTMFLSIEDGKFVWKVYSTRSNCSLASPKLWIDLSNWYQTWETDMRWGWVCRWGLHHSIPQGLVYVPHLAWFLIPLWISNIVLFSYNQCLLAQLCCQGYKYCLSICSLRDTQSGKFLLTFLYSLWFWPSLF